MKPKANNALGQFEQLVITAVIALGENACGLAAQATPTEFHQHQEGTDAHETAVKK